MCARIIPALHTCISYRALDYDVGKTKFVLISLIPVFQKLKPDASDPYFEPCILAIALLSGVIEIGYLLLENFQNTGKT
jgi:hypothetical protein